MDAIDPEPALDGTSGRNPYDVEDQQLGIRSGREVSTGCFPEVRIFKLFARKVDGSFVEVLDHKLRSARALDVIGFEIDGELVIRVRLDGNDLPYADIVDSAAIENNR